jgi:hypothetical protein
MIRVGWHSAILATQMKQAHAPGDILEQPIDSTVSGNRYVETRISGDLRRGGSHGVHG